MPSVANVARPSATYGAALDDLLLRLAVAPDRPLVIETAQLQPARFATEASPEEVLQAFGDVYSLSSAVGGAGLFDRYRREGTEADATRFWDSKYVDVSPTQAGAPDEIRLLNTTENVDALTGNGRLATSGDTIWVCNGQVLRKSTNAGNAWANDDPHDSETATDVGDVATLGSVPYAALGANGIHRDVSGWSHWSDVQAVRVWSVNDRIIASDGTALYEAAAGATSVLLYTLPDGTQWNSAVAAGQAIFAAASNGYVYGFQLDDNGDLLVAGQTEFREETPHQLAARGDQVFVTAFQGDELRLWRCTVDGPTLIIDQLIWEWFECGCSAMNSTRDRILVSIKEDNDESWVWQYELATAGIFRAHRAGTGHARGIATIGGVLFVGVDDDGVYRETSTLEASGWLIGPRADFFRADEKSWITAWADVQVSAGQVVELYVSTVRAAMFDHQHPSWLRVRSYAADSAGQEIGLGSNVVARSMAMQVRLFSAANSSPRVRAVSARAYPTIGDVLVQLPVDVGDQIERFGRSPVRVNGWGGKVMEALRGKEGAAVLCTVYRTGDVIRGLVESVATPVPAITPRGSPTMASFVTVRGRRVPELQSTFSAQGWGGWAWGSQPWGGGG
jgi:hypothetical protein